MCASQLTYLEPTDSEEEDPSTTLAEDQIYDFITNEPVKDSPKERALQAVARSLVYEYGFDHTQLERDVIVTYEVTDPHGRTRRARRKVDLVIYPEGKPKELKHIVRVGIVQPPGTKAQDRKKGVDLLEEVMGALPTCDYGLWTNGADLEFRQKVTGGGRIQPEYVELYDLPGEGETAAALDNPRRQVMRIATGDNLKRTFARVHDYIYGNQGLKKDVAFWQVVNLIFCKIHDEKAGGRPRFYVKGTERNTSEGQAAIAARVHDLFKEVKTDSDYTAVFTERDTITLNNRVLAYVVGELSRYNLLKSDVDVKGAAYNGLDSPIV
jgi:type I restriction enzyme M protein